MASIPSPLVDPAGKPLTAEQSTSSALFRIPREVRDNIYGHIFSDDGRTRNSEAALPLLTCRQFYFEARVIAFSTINWCINWDQTIQKYFDGKALSPAGESVLVFRLPVPRPWPTRNPYDFTVQAMCWRAGLFKQHCAALRYLTITHYWCRHNKSAEPETGIFYHLLESLSHVITSDFQLDCLEIELSGAIDCNGLSPRSHD
ncbi:hypothetical protein BDW02DRAFT_565305 [Decorospora gaudefroyi]|uniref:Uncharacterized protein n=1 Tax=Decorospora gaudefroyi TaxID=184978 RepID=A0A6A5KU66_9PLEO|nr:hypothetical protein BDW02DRAFT_565305 [Decorospora gaudefroyi]